MTLAVVKANGVKTLKADKTNSSPEIDQLLVELGNTTTAIPYYAVYPADGGAPIIMEGPITPWQVIGALRAGGQSQSKNVSATAMN